MKYYKDFKQKNIKIKLNNEKKPKRRKLRLQTSSNKINVYNNYVFKQQKKSIFLKPIMNNQIKKIKGLKIKTQREKDKIVKKRKYSL